MDRPKIFGSNTTPPGLIEDLILWWQYEKHGTTRSLAKALKVTPATLYYWLHESAIPVKHVKKIEELTEYKFTAKMMRPDVFPIHLKPQINQPKKAKNL